MVNLFQGVSENLEARELSENPDTISLLCQSMATSTTRRIFTVYKIRRASSMVAH